MHPWRRCCDEGHYWLGHGQAEAAGCQQGARAHLAPFREAGVWVEGGRATCPSLPIFVTRYVTFYSYLFSHPFLLFFLSSLRSFIFLLSFYFSFNPSLSSSFHLNLALFSFFYIKYPLLQPSFFPFFLPNFTFFFSYFLKPSLSSLPSFTPSQSHFSFPSSILPCVSFLHLILPYNIFHSSSILSSLQSFSSVLPSLSLHLSKSRE